MRLQLDTQAQAPLKSWTTRNPCTTTKSDAMHGDVPRRTEKLTSDCMVTCSYSSTNSENSATIDVQSLAVFSCPQIRQLLGDFRFFFTVSLKQCMPFLLRYIWHILSNFIHQRVRGKNKQKQYTINTKIQSICKIIKRSLVCSLQNKL